MLVKSTIFPTGRRRVRARALSVFSRPNPCSLFRPLVCASAPPFCRKRIVVPLPRALLGVSVWAVGGREREKETESERERPL